MEFLRLLYIDSQNNHDDDGDTNDITIPTMKMVVS